MTTPVTIEERDDGADAVEPPTAGSTSRPGPLGAVGEMFGCGVLVTAFRRLRREVDEQVRADRLRAAERRARRASRPSTEGHDARSADVSAADDDDDGAAPLEAADLALPDYDHLPASQIVAMLGDLAPDERAAIEAYERAHRNRRTVLGKLARLG